MIIEFNGGKKIMKKQPKVINVHVKIMKKKECPKKIVKVKRKRGMGKVLLGVLRHITLCY